MGSLRPIQGKLLIHLVDDRLGPGLSCATNWLWTVSSHLLSLGLSFPIVQWERSGVEEPCQPYT